MKRHARFLFALLLPVMSAACERKHDAAVTPPLATKPAETKPLAIHHPATRPISLITVNDQVFTFPPAKLVLQQNASGVIATLFSDDPPEAVKDSYRGNSFRFEVNFDNASLDDVSGQQYVWKNSAEDKQDSLTGIFLNGQQQTVRPLSATLTLLKVGEQWTASIGGEFEYLDNQKPDAAAVSIHAYADMTADLVTVAAKP